MWSRKFYKKGIRKFYKKGIGKRKEDLAGNVGENVAGWGTWAKRGTRPEFQGGHSQSKITRTSALEGRRNPVKAHPL
jgi:hypothetical protein